MKESTSPAASPGSNPTSPAASTAGPSTEAEGSPSKPTLKPSEAPPGDPPAPAQPPATKVVLEGEATEETLKLRKRVKDLETQAATLQDDNRRLKTIPPTPQPVTEEKAAEQKKSFLDGCTLFD